MKFKKENGPHVKSEDTTSKIMTRLLIALTPIVCFAIFKNSILVYFYTDASVLEAMHPVFMIASGVLSSYIFELLYFKLILKKSFHESIFEIDRSFAIIPGLLLALVLPVNTPIWLIIFGTFISNILGKMLFGGFGQNIFNPALLGYLFISVSYSSLMGSALNSYEIDTLGGATPLSNLASLNYYGTYEQVVGSFGNLLNFFVGTIPGTLGETSKLLIIIAFIYLVITKTIKWKIPVAYISTAFIMTLVIGHNIGLGIWYPLFLVLSGGLLFGAVFMATDPVTSPITSVGQIFYGISLGILTIALRFLTPYPEAVMTSILFMNMLVPLFDKIGLYFKYNFKKIWILIITFVLLTILTIFNISSNINDSKNKSTSELDNKVTITEVKNESNKRVYSVTSKAWGVLKAEVEVVDKEIKSIIITDSSGETQWNEIEKNNYIDKVIANQKDIDSLDAVSGSTYSSNGLKNIVRKIMEEELKNEG